MQKSGICCRCGQAKKLLRKAMPIFKKTGFESVEDSSMTAVNFSSSI